MDCGEGEGRCKRHPEQRQQSGVCYSCLIERLSNLSSLPTLSAQNKPAIRHLSSSASPSPNPPPRTRLNRNASDSAGRVAGGRKSRLFKKSRSLLRFGRENGRSFGDVPGGGNGKVRVKKKKEGGFWSKLISSKSRQEATAVSS